MFSDYLISSGCKNIGVRAVNQNSWLILDYLTSKYGLPVRNIDYLSKLPINFVLAQTPLIVKKS